MKCILEKLVAEARSDPSDSVSSPAVHDVEILGSLPGIGTKVLATLTSACAVERRFPVTGANPVQPLSLRLVAALAYDGGNDMI